MSKNIELLKELYDLKHKLNTIIDKVHENMRENNQELLAKYNLVGSSDSETEQQNELDSISNSSKSSNDEKLDQYPNLLESIIDKTNESSINPIINSKVAWVPPKNRNSKIHNETYYKHK